MPVDGRDAKDSRCEALSSPGRLRSQRAIDSLFQGGKRLQGKYLTLIYRLTPDGLTRFAVFVPKRLGTAVRRNRARRVLRETLRRHQHTALEGKDTIILCKRPVSEDLLDNSKHELIELLDRLEQE